MLQPFIHAIQDAAVIDKAADPVQPPLRHAFRSTSQSGRAVKNFLSGTWIGHPLHPIVKDVPIGAWTMAAIFDAAGQRAADVAVATGIAGALASAVTGLADWTDTTGRPRRIGAVHALLNISSTGLYAASLIARLRDRRSVGVQLAYCGYAVMLLGAYLGGHLVFAEQIGVNHAAFASLPTDFAAVLPENELQENEPKLVTHNGLRIVLVRRGSRIHALYERCSHMGGPLSQGALEDGSIRCPWHGSRFSLEDGSVCEGPATSPVPCFETRVANGMIEIRSSQAEAP